LLERILDAIDINLVKTPGSILKAGQELREGALA
jgi:hypothetical protein